MKELVLLWLAGASLRITLLAIPPLIPPIHAEFAMSQAAIGALTSLPVLLFAFAAIPGSLLVSRMGSLRVITLGLFITASLLLHLVSKALVLLARVVQLAISVGDLHPAAVELEALSHEWVIGF